MAIVVAGLARVGADAAFPDQVKVEGGAVKGAVADGVLSFKGIPFAAPPVGDLRWRPPQPVVPWTGVKEATAYGHDCAQKPVAIDAAPLGTEPSEDCLVLNVWRPAEKTSAALPVMVWIYGGGFVNGGSSPAVYDGSQFAKQGVVLVSFNYRIGRFGFFAHPALSAEHPGEPLGNYALMDQIAALKWVQKHIAGFGGNPKDVTVFGESAGGMSVHALLTSPAAKGLFHKAIIESGGGRSGLLTMRKLHEDQPNQPSAESVGVAFAKSNGDRRHRRGGVEGAARAADRQGRRRAELHDDGRRQRHLRRRADPRREDHGRVGRGVVQGRPQHEGADAGRRQQPGHRLLVREDDGRGDEAVRCRRGEGAGGLRSEQDGQPAGRRLPGGDGPRS